MGQYVVCVNHDRKEYIHPHRVGDGLKPWEICANADTARLAAFLMMDVRQDSAALPGPWAGDHVTWVGNYRADAEPGELPPMKTPVWDVIVADYRDVTLPAVRLFNGFIGAADLKLSYYPAEAEVKLREKVVAYREVKAYHPEPGKFYAVYRESGGKVGWERGKHPEGTVKPEE